MPINIIKPSMISRIFLSILIVSQAFAEGPPVQNSPTPKPVIKKALPVSKGEKSAWEQSQQATRIQALIFQVVREKPSMAPMIQGMQRVLLTPQAMENYLQSLAKEQAPGDEVISGTPSDAAAIEATAKVDAEMERLEASKGYNLGAGADPASDSNNVVKTSTDDYSQGSGKDSGEMGVVARSQAAMEELKKLGQAFAPLDNAAANDSRPEVIQARRAAEAQVRRILTTSYLSGNVPFWQPGMKKTTSTVNPSIEQTLHDQQETNVNK